MSDTASQGAAAIPNTVRYAFGLGACALLALSFIVGAAAAWRIVPWPAGVIAGGGAVLAAPLLLRPMPDRFVNGRAALVAFSGASVVLALALALL